MNTRSVAAVARLVLAALMLTRAERLSIWLGSVLPSSSRSRPGAKAITSEPVPASKPRISLMLLATSRPAGFEKFQITVSALPSRKPWGPELALSSTRSLPRPGPKATTSDPALP